MTHHPQCYSQGCHTLATTSLHIGARTWPDGRTLYTFACTGHVQQVLDAQARLETSVTVHAWSPDHAVLCAAYWRSHACGLPDDHTDDHVCGAWECEDSPRPGDPVLNWVTDEPCAHTGGVAA